MLPTPHLKQHPYRHKVTGLLLLLSSCNTQAALTCHIHAPVSDREKERPKIVGPYPSTATCEKENLRLFLGKGRCHCSFDNRSLLQPRSNDMQDDTVTPEALP